MTIQEENFNKVKELLKMQGQHGNFDYCEYMRGMYNGMELCVAILEERDPIYKDYDKNVL
jgi:hypothetical protein